MGHISSVALSDYIQVYWTCETENDFPCIFKIVYMYGGC
jgi:hypothetical protein